MKKQSYAELASNIDIDDFISEESFAATSIALRDARNTYITLMKMYLEEQKSNVIYTGKMDNELDVPDIQESTKERKFREGSPFYDKTLIDTQEMMLHLKVDENSTIPRFFYDSLPAAEKGYRHEFGFVDREGKFVPPRPVIRALTEIFEIKHGTYQDFIADKIRNAQIYWLKKQRKAVMEAMK